MTRRPIKRGWGGSEDGGSVPSVLPDPQYPNDPAIYREGELAPAGNVHATFGEAHAQLAAAGGGRLVVDGSKGTPEVPLGESYDMTGIIPEGRGLGLSLVLQEGCSLTNFFILGDCLVS
jgi:hypothetical protein